MSRRNTFVKLRKRKIKHKRVVLNKSRQTKKTKLIKQKRSK